MTTPFCLLDPADRAMLTPDVEDAWPLTMMQSGMIYHTMLEEQTPVYHDLFDLYYGISKLVSLVSKLVSLATLSTLHLSMLFLVLISLLSRKLNSRALESRN
jgi:hypothetical protein